MGINRTLPRWLVATYAISTTESGPAIRRRFCSRRVLHRAAMCEHIVESEESSTIRYQAMVSEVRGDRMRRRLTGFVILQNLFEIRHTPIGPRLTCIKVRYQNHCFGVNPSLRNWAKIVPIMGSDL